MVRNIPIAVDDDREIAMATFRIRGVQTASHRYGEPEMPYIKVSTKRVSP